MKRIRLSLVLSRPVSAVYLLAIFTLLLIGGQSARALTTVLVTNNVAGSYTWVCPLGVTSVQVESWGAGGGGGGAFGTGHADAGGGAGGAYARTNSYAVTSGVTYYIQVGAGGGGGAGATSVPGTAGGDSWFSNATAVVVLAKGGTGGNGAPSGGIGGVATAPAASSSIGGDATYAGGNGGAGVFSTAGGAGGSSAGTAAAGNNGANGGTAPTTAPAGGGAGGASASAAAGVSGSGPGGGGGGGGNSSNLARKGGSGADGQVILTYTIPFLTVGWIGDGINNFWSTNTGNICWDSDANGTADSDYADGDIITFGLAGTNNPTVNIATRVAPTSLTVSSTSNYVFTGSGWISGATSLAQSGTGLLTINTLNDYSGGTTISGGQLLMGNDNVLGTGLVTLSGGSISSDGGTARTLTNAVMVTVACALGDATHNGKLTFTAPVDFGGASRNLTNNSDVVFAGGATNGVIGQKNGPGTLTINGLVNYSGASDIYNGTEIFNGAMVTNLNRIIPDATAGNTARLVITNGTTITISGAPNNLRVGRAGDPTGTNYVDLAGLLNLPGADAADGNVALYGGCAYAQVTFWPGGDFTARGVTNFQGMGNTVFKFNGGILRALQNNATFFQGVSQALVQAGGANIDDSGFAITINQALLDGTGGGGLTKIGSGTLTLNAANAYTGNTVVNAGTLALGASGSVAGGIVVASGATFDVSAVSSFALGSGQTLSNSASTAILNGSANASSGTISLTYASGTPSFAVASGTLTLSSGTTFNVNNTGAILTKGSYKIISSTGGLVAGTLPSVTVSGGGTAATPSLSISGNELYLVVADQAPVIANIVTNSVNSGFTWKIGISSLSNSAAWSDPDGDALTLSSVGPTSFNGATVTSDANYIYYNAPVTTEDHFSYVITDGTLTATNTVYLEAVNPNGYYTQNYTTPPIVNNDNSITLNLASIPGSTNIVQVTTDLTSPIIWTSISTNVAGTNGLWQFTDTNPPMPNAFYRTAKP